MAGEHGVHVVVLEQVEVELPVRGLEVEIVLRLVDLFLDDGAVGENEHLTGPAAFPQLSVEPDIVFAFLLVAVVLEVAAVGSDEGAALVAEGEAVIAVARQIALHVAFLPGLEVMVAGDIPDGNVLVDPAHQVLESAPLLFVEAIVDHVSGHHHEGRMDAVDGFDGLRQEPDALLDGFILLESQLRIGNLHEEEGTGGRCREEGEAQDQGKNDSLRHDRMGLVDQRYAIISYICSLCSLLKWKKSNV